MFLCSLLNHAAPIFLLLLWLDVPMGVRANAINTTIDDADSRIRYSDHWNIGGSCNGCSALIPEGERRNAYQATWHDASSSEGGTHFNVTFTGSACYVYGVLRNGNQTKIGYPALVNLTFIMDGKVVGHFEREPSGNDQWLFNQLVFSKYQMSEGLHNLMVMLEPKSLFLFDYLKITSNQSDPLAPVSMSTTTTAKNNDTVIIASISGVIGALAFIGLILFWLFRRRRKRGVRVIVPRDPFLLGNHPRGSDSPPAHISPFYETPRYRISGHTEYDGDHEGVLLLAGARVTGDRKSKNLLYNVPEEPVSSYSLHDLSGPQVASTSATDVPSREPSPPLTLATYATSMNGGIRDSVYSSVTPDHAYTVPESRDFRSALFTQTAVAIPLRPLHLRSSSSSESPPIQPIPQRPSFYPPAVAAAEISQKQMSAQTLPPLPPVSHQPMTATTVLPPYRRPVHASRLHPPHDSRTPQ